MIRTSTCLIIMRALNILKEYA